MLGFGKKKDTAIKLKAPVSGTVIPLEDVPDPAFAGAMVGDGAAVEPTSDVVLAPCDATVAVLFSTGHAIALETPQGLELLIHIGIETVNMKGEGFEKLVAQGDTVKAGTPLIRFDKAAIAAAGNPTVTPVLITNTEKIKSMKIAEGEVKAGETDLLEVELT